MADSRIIDPSVRPRADHGGIAIEILDLDGRGQSVNGVWNQFLSGSASGPPQPVSDPRHHSVDLCALRETLLVDSDRIYDLG
jgi:hypothetical protein